MNAAFERQGRALLSATAAALATAPMAHTQMLMALDFALGPAKEIVIAGPSDAAATTALLTAVRAHYLARSVVALHPPEAGGIEVLVRS